MEAAEFLRKRKEYKGGQLFFLYGNEPYLVDTTAKQLVSELRVANFEFNYTLYREKADFHEVLDMCRQMPCFAEYRVVQLEDLDLFEKNSKMPELLEHLPEHTKLVIVKHGKLDNRKVFTKALMSKAVCVLCDPLTDAAMLRWITSSAKKQGVILPRQSAELIYEVCGSDMYAIRNEINKLKFYPAAHAERGIEALLSASTEYDTFSFHKLMMAGEYEKAMDILRKVQKDRKNFAGFIGLVISKISPIYMAKSCLNAGWTQRMAIAEMQKAGIKEYPARLACEDAAHFTMLQLKQALRILEGIDFSIKSGKGSDGIETAMLRAYGAV